MVRFSALFRAAAVLLVLMAGGCTGTLVERAADRAVEETHTELFGDGRMHAFLCGTGIPLSVRGRAGACTAVIAAGQFILVDTGQGSWANIAAERLPAGRLSAILLTHFHSDHIAELGEAATQSWVRGRTGMLDVYGPAGVEQVVEGFNTAYGLDRGYRVAHHGAEHMPPDAGRLQSHTVSLPAPDAAAVVIEKDGLRVTAFAVDHEPASPAYGYRFEYRGKVLVLSGDTAKSENLVRHASGADVLIHEVVAKHLASISTDRLKELGQTRLARMAEDALSYHTSAAEAVEVARRSGAKKLVFTHLAPALSPLMPDLVMRWVFFDSLRTGFDGPVVFGTDGMWIHAGS